MKEIIVQLIDYSEELDQKYAGFYGNSYKIDRYIGGNYIIRGVIIPQDLIKEKIESDNLEEGDKVYITGDCIRSISERSRDNDYFSRFVGKTGIVSSINTDSISVNGEKLYTIDLFDDLDVIGDVNWFFESSVEKFNANK